jgi:hypothetical protein
VGAKKELTEADWALIWTALVELGSRGDKGPYAKQIEGLRQEAFRQAGSWQRFLPLLVDPVK